MIEINLLPGSQKSRRAGGAPDLRALGATIAQRISDPFLVVALVSAVLGSTTVGLLHLRHSRAEAEVQARYEAAAADSARYAAVIADRKAAEAQRDSVMRQINIIRSIDDDRFVWSHVLEEVSRALPAYTWVTTIQQTSAVVTVASLMDSTAAPAAGDSVAAIADEELPSAEARAPRFRLVGQTIDIQALTLFMKQLEASPFIKGVQLARSDVATADGKQITEFQLDAAYEVPPPAMLRTVPINLAVR